MVHKGFPGDNAVNEKPQLSSVSIVLPVRNEAKFIENCLESLVRQDYANITRILVFDGMSTDATKKIVLRFVAADRRIELHDNPRKVKPHALNQAAEMVQENVIVIADAHALYEPDYVTQCVNCLGSTGAANVGGPAIPSAGSSYVSRAIVFAHESRFGIGVAKFRQRSYEGYVDSVWPGAYRKGAFDEIAPFREELTRNEDIDRNARLRLRGYKVYVSPKIRATYFTRDSLSGLWHQNLANGCAVSQTLFINRRALSLRHLIPVVFLMAIIGSILGAFVTPLALFALGGILASYLALCILFGIQVGLKHGVRYVPIMPIMFWTIHFSYGLGTLWGLLKYGVIERTRR
jgi:succinoglycan biosynthesis protein ExoA